MKQSATWLGLLDSTLEAGSVGAEGHRIADAARDGDWTALFELLTEQSHFGVNRWRPGGTTWFTPLHQAAWHGAPPSVATELLERGAARMLRDAEGRTAYDIAVERGHAGSLGEVLKPTEPMMDEKKIALLDQGLRDVIDGRLRGKKLGRTDADGDIRSALRYPPVEILHEMPGRSVWFAVPGMYGGFHITLRQGYLESSSWSRVVGGSGQLHVITHEGAVLVDEGFV